jgi:hypothetical protein
MFTCQASTVVLDPTFTSAIAIAIGYVHSVGLSSAARCSIAASFAQAIIYCITTTSSIAIVSVIYVLYSSAIRYSAAIFSFQPILFRSRTPFPS